MPGLNQRRAISNITEASNLDDIAGVSGLMPRFIRRSSVPAGRQVVSDEVDAEMYDKADGDILSFKDLSSWLKSEKDENKDEPWARLNELATFAMCGHGQYSASLAVGVYGKETKSTLQRQGLTERDRLRGQGVRVHIETRIAHPSNLRLRQALGSENKQGMNQCVIRHLALSLELWLNGKHFPIPDRSRIDLPGAEIRASEYAKAQICSERIKKPNALLGREIWSALHDAMNIGHDRSFTRMG